MQPRMSLGPKWINPALDPERGSPCQQYAHSMDLWERHLGLGPAYGMVLEQALPALALACPRGVLSLPGVCLQFAHRDGRQSCAPSDLSPLT